MAPRKRKPQPPAPASDDDDTPEEVSLAGAKEAAQQQKSVEKQQRQTNRLTRSRRGKPQEDAAEAEQQQQEEPAAEPAAAADAAAEPEPKRRTRGRGRKDKPDDADEEADAAADEGCGDHEGDFLAPEVLAALADRQQAAAQPPPSQQQLQQAQISRDLQGRQQQQQQQKRLGKRLKLTEVKKGPVVVQVLDEQKPFSSSGGWPDRGLVGPAVSKSQAAAAVQAGWPHGAPAVAPPKHTHCRVCPAADRQVRLPADAAAAFMKAKLFGERKRSYDMLQWRKGAFEPAKKFV
jgi:hypothetical protein